MELSSSLPDGSRFPQGGILHGLLAAKFPGYHERRLLRKRPVTILADVNAYLDCGNMRRNKATLECTKCLIRREFPLSCKRRNFCEACGLRRQRDRGDFLRHKVIGATPMRLWTVTLPHPARTFLGGEPQLTTAVLGAVLRRITRYIRMSIKRAQDLTTVRIVHTGAITVIQRVGTDLDGNLHFHILFTNGAFVQLRTDDGLTFVELPQPTDEDIAEIARDIAKGVRKELWRANFWEDGEPEGDRTISGHFVSRDGEAKRFRFTGVAANGAPRPKGVGAVNVDVRPPIGGEDHENLARILAYMLAPAVRDKHLTVQPDSVLLELKRERTDGTTHRQLTFDQLFDRLAFMVPPRYANLIRFHGVYAPNAALRADVVPEGQEPTGSAPPAREDDEVQDDHLAWAELRTHSFAADMMRCPRCRGRLKLVALVSGRINYRRGHRAPPD